MNNTKRGIRASLIIHAAVLLVVTWSARSAIVPGKPMVIDFSIVDAKADLRNDREKNPSPASPQQRPKTRQAQAAQPVTPPLPAVDSNPLPATQNQVKLPVARTVEPGAVVQEGGKGEAKSIATETRGIKAGTGAASVARLSVTPEEEKKKYLKEHFAYIRDVIMKNLSYPPLARRMGWSGKVLVSFVVMDDGSVEQPRVVESSGFSVLDKNAVETVLRVSPFPRPPVRAELVVPIVYKFD